MKIHRSLLVIGGLFKTACGRFMRGPNITAYHEEATCVICRGPRLKNLKVTRRRSGG